MTFNSKLQQKDRLSGLPHEILVHILSFFGTKCAVRTSVLSKRWRNIWADVPNLDFDDEYKHDDLGFKTFVSRVLAFHDVPYMNKFRLRCCFEDFSGVERWIRTALRRNVVEIDLSVISENDESFELPEAIFTSKTLKALSLRSNFVVDDPIAYHFSIFKNFLPVTSLFPSLKLLFVRIFHPDVESMRNLFSWFPVLEDLTIDGTIGDERLNLDIKAPKLKKLTISLRTEVDSEDEGGEEEGGEDDGGEEGGGEDDQSEDLNGIGAYHFYIVAPKLETLNLRVDILSNSELKYGKSLVKANIDLYDHFASEHPTQAKSASALLASISNVKYMSLSAHCLEASSLPSFNKLKELKLVFQDCHRSKSLLLGILERSPNLEGLIIDREVNSCGCTAEECSENSLETPQAVPLCLMSKLETISIMRFRGLTEEMEVVKCLLKNCQVLKTMTVSTLRLTNCVDLEELRRSLRTHPRGSKTCKVEFM